MKAIACMSANRVIGKDGKLPWSSIKEDFRFFKEKTINGNIIVGYKTFQKLPPLSMRDIYVLRSKLWNKLIPEPCENNIFDKHNCAAHGHYINESMLLVKCNTCPEFDENTWVCGGAEVYRSMLQFCTDLYITVLNQNCEGDTYMPDFEWIFPTKKLEKEFDFGSIFHYHK